MEKECDKLLERTALGQRKGSEKMVVINKGACVGCGACVEDCFSGNLALEEGKAQVKSVCMECGHCVAVCPMKAVSIEGYEMEDAVELGQLGKTASPKELLNLIRSRRSIRQFKPQPLEQEVIAQVLEAGRYTPTAVNRQDVRYIVVQQELEEMKKLVWEGFRKVAASAEGTPMAAKLQRVCQRYDENPEMDPLFFQAPALVVVTAHSKLSGSLAAGAVEMMAHAQGLGVLVSGFIEGAINTNPKAKEFLGIYGKEICCCMLMGYPAVAFQRTAPRKKVAVSWR